MILHMKRLLISLAALALCLGAGAQDDLNAGLECTSIMVGRLASADGSVITSHTCDGKSHTWVTIEPARRHRKGEMHNVYRGTRHTAFPKDTTGLRYMGTIPEAASTYSYLNTGYPCMNEKQLGIGETTFTGPEVLRSSKGIFLVEELCRIALQRCDNAREACVLMGSLAEQYGYADGGECLSVADKNEVWQFEILGAGKDTLGAVWAAQRVPDGEVAVSANIPRIGVLRPGDDDFLCSEGIEKVALKYGLWDGEGRFVFWKAFNSSYGNGRNFREREFYIFRTLAPSQGFTWDMPELPFSVKPDEKVDVRKVMEIFRATYEGTEFDMCRNVLIDVPAKGDKPAGSKVSPVANPWLTTDWRRTLNQIAPGTVEFTRTVAVAWCSYSTVIQLRNWLPDAVGGICWYSVDNPAQSPRIPIFCGATKMPGKDFDHNGQCGYKDESVLWRFRKANKLATLEWQVTKKEFTEEVVKMEDIAFEGLPALEADPTPARLNRYTKEFYDKAVARWKELEEKYWVKFGRGF